MLPYSQLIEQFQPLAGAVIESVLRKNDLAAVGG